MGSFTPNAESARTPSTPKAVRLRLPRHRFVALYGVQPFGGLRGSNRALAHCASVKYPRDAIFRWAGPVPLSKSNSSQKRTKYEDCVNTEPWGMSEDVRIG